MNIADKILQNQDRDGMLRRSLERIIQLYTDKSHFVYELLQNAEDAGATGIRFVQYSDRLEVMHDGKSFTTENLQGLCDIGQSDKVNDLNQIGEFGVGFKSVFGICETVRLYSSPRKKELAENCHPFAVEIQDFTKPVDIPSVDVPAGYTTLFVFPYSVGFQFSGFKNLAALNEAITKRLKNLGVTTLLFMRHLELIEYEIKIPGKEASGEYLLDAEPVNDHCTRVSAIESEDDKTDESLSFIKFSMPIDSRVSTRTIDVAFTVATDKEGKTTFQKAKNPYISVYFPTETESKLDFIVQGPFRTTPNRSSVPADEEENEALAEQTAKLLRQSVLELRDMGLLDLSLIRILPLDEDDFDVYPLFYPLYEEMRDLFSSERVLPVKDGKGYTKAANAVIARSREIAELLPSELISELINDKRHYEWLPVSLTETGPYKDVLSYFSSILGIEVIRPEDLRSYFNENHNFLENRDNDWLVRLYKLYETVPNIFSESNYRNILDAVIVRTASNRMVAPYRKSQSSYLPNVFLPSKKAMQAEVEFVHPYLFENCRSFFEDVLHLKMPNEYEHFVKSLEKRYAGADFNGSFEEHVQDIHILVKYLRDSDYEADLRQIVRKAFYIKCRSGGKAYWVRPHSKVIRFPQSETGLMLEQYYKGIAPDIYFVDFDAYQSAGITFDDLRALGVTDKIITGDEKTWGEYYTGNPGRQPEWRTTGDFRWKLGIDKLEEALLYISQHAKAKDALIKSQVIFKTLQENMSRLVGTVYIGGGTPNKYDEPADVIHTLNRDGFNWRLSDWNGKWLYTESGELVSHKAISKHDLNKSLYGKVSLDSNLYDILGFKKGKIDQHEAIVKDYDALPDEKKQTYFEIELERRFHITPEQLSREFGGLSLQEGSTGQSEEDEFEFPTGSVKNWEALKKHAAQILSYASPTVYATVVRRIRVSRPQDDVRAYLMNMYRVNSSYRYACQLCHKPFSNVEMCQLEQKPDVELDPLNVCLCPNCAAKFRTLRNDKYLADRLIDSILDVSENDIEENDHVSVAINDYDFWFTPTHIAEIIELLKLKKKAAEERKAQLQTASNPKPKEVAKAPESNRVAPVQPVKEETPHSTPEPEEEGLQSDTSAYGELIGRRVFHKSKKAYARVVGCDGEYVVLNFESGDKAGQDVKYNLTMCLNNGWIEVVD